MYQRFEAEELDADTLEYLRAVREREGHGMPGVYFGGKKARLFTPTLLIWAAVCGPLLIALTLFLTWEALADPVSTAMLQTAGIFLGGWLFLAWVRDHLARRRSDYIGYFKYIDALYIWIGTGRGVETRSVEMVQGAYTEHTYNPQGAYRYTTIKVKLADGKEAFDVRSHSRAERLVEFLTSLAEQAGGDPVDRGYVAVAQINSEDSEDDYDVTERVIRSIPRPHRVRSSKAWLWLFLLPILGVGLFVACQHLATIQRDDAYFEAVKFGQAEALRAYLADRRNSRHRLEVQEKLREQAESRVRQFEQQGDPALATGLADVIRAVASDVPPLITLCILKPDVPADMLSPALLETMNRQIIKEISDKLAVHVGQNIADYAAATEPPAKIKFQPKIAIPKPGADARIEWTVTLQAAPDAKEHTLTLITSEKTTAETPWPAIRAAYLKLGPEFAQLLAGQRAK